MSRLPTAVERAAYDQEVQRASQEDRDPEWSSLSDLVSKNIAEENLVWGSQSMKDYGRKGRHDAHGTNPEHDEEHGVVTDGAPTTTYVQTVPDDSEHIAEQVKAREAAKADNSINPDVYDPNYQLGQAIAAGVKGDTHDDTKAQEGAEAELEALSQPEPKEDTKTKGSKK